MADAQAATIEPNAFDLIVLGTGIQQSILAAAAATAGHSVLQLDPCDFYGSHSSSLPLRRFLHWTASRGAFPLPPDSDTPHLLPQPPHEAPHPTSSAMAAEPGLQALKLRFGSHYSHFTVWQPSECDTLGPSHRYNIDLSGPKMAFCAGPLVDLLLRSGASNYLEFKGIEATYLWTPSGLRAVPSSRSDVFKDRTLAPSEKRHLMRFFKLVIDFTTSNPHTELSDEVLDAPFVELLCQQRLPSAIQEIILYAIALADADQSEILDAPYCNIIKARDGLHTLGLYLLSVGKFPNASGAFLYPLYGQGELPQAFSRCAAVKGALQVLRLNANAVLWNKEGVEYKGILTSSGQLLFSNKLVAGPLEVCFDNVSNKSPLESQTGKQNTQQGLYSRDLSIEQSQQRSYTARGICITDKSLQNGQSTIMVVFPPNSVSKSTTVIRALQLGSDASVSPEGKFIVQFSTICSEELIGIESLQLAARVLFDCENSITNEEACINLKNTSISIHIGNKPSLLFSAFYIQQPYNYEIPKPWDCPGQIAMFGLPDGMLDYRSAIISAEKVFNVIFPGEDFFPSAQEAKGCAQGVENDVAANQVDNNHTVEG